MKLSLPVKALLATQALRLYLIFQTTLVQPDCFLVFRTLEIQVLGRLCGKAMRNVFGIDLWVATLSIVCFNQLY